MEANLCSFFMVSLYMYCDGDPVIKRGWVWIPIIGLTLPHFCAWISNVMVFIVFSEFS